MTPDEDHLGELPTIPEPARSPARDLAAEAMAGGVIALAGLVAIHYLAPSLAPWIARVFA